MVRSDLAVAAILNVTSTLNFTDGLARRVAAPYADELSLTLKLLAPIWPAIIFFGLFSNITNIVVFLKAGVKDNVFTLLLSLAVSDLTFLILITPSMCCFVVVAYAKDWIWPFDFRFLTSLPYWPAFTAYDLSAFISVSLGVTRCACVAMPLKFKLVFTKPRTVKWVLFLAVLSVSLRVPVLSIFRVAWRTDPATNVSHPYVTGVNSVSMSHINDILNRGFVIWINYTVMITCVAVLSFKLYESSKLRQSCTAIGRELSDQGPPDKTAFQGLSMKDLQVVKSVVLICVIFILSQLPFLMVSTARLIDSEFSIDFKFRALFAMFSQISRTCSYLNASLNIFVYYNYNSKYRAVLLSLLPCSGKRMD